MSWLRRNIAYQVHCAPNSWVRMRATGCHWQENDKNNNFFSSIWLTGIFLLNFFACSTCTFGDLTMMSLAFGLTIFVAVMVINFIFCLFSLRRNEMISFNLIHWIITTVAGNKHALSNSIHVRSLVVARAVLTKENKIFRLPVSWASKVLMKSIAKYENWINSMSALFHGVIWIVVANLPSEMESQPLSHTYHSHLW